MEEKHKRRSPRLNPCVSVENMKYSVPTTTNQNAKAKDATEKTQPNLLHLFFQIYLYLKLNGFILHLIRFCAFFVILLLGYGCYKDIITSCHMMKYSTEWIYCNTNKAKHFFMMSSLVIINMATLILGFNSCIIDGSRNSTECRLSDLFFLLCCFAGGVPSLWILATFSSKVKKFKFIFFLLLTSFFTAFWFLAFLFQ